MNKYDLIELQDLLNKTRQKQTKVLWLGLSLNKENTQDLEIKAQKTKIADDEHKIGLAYLFGEGIKRDTQKGILFVRRASKQGHANALVTLGAMNLTGRAHNVDLPKAINALSLAQEAGSPEALFWLGIYYLYNGKEKKPDPVKARELHDEAIKQGIDEVYVAKIKELEAAGEYEC